MKLVIVNGSGETLGEVKLSSELLRRPDVLSERVSRTIARAVGQKQAPETDRIVENLGVGTLEALDEDSSVMDVPLKLKDACRFDFGKHVEAISQQEAAAVEDHKRFTRLNPAQENQKRYDTRYKERPGNRIRFK